MKKVNWQTPTNFFPTFTTQHSFFEGSIGLNICFEVSVERQAVVDIRSKGVHLVPQNNKSNKNFGDLFFLNLVKSRVGKLILCEP